MRVSIALHTDDPGEDGNQRTYEAQYMNYNRLHGDLVIDRDGNALLEMVGLKFAASGETAPDWAPQEFRFISLGVCTGPGTNSGGSIIIRGPLEPPIVANVKGSSPFVRHFACGVIKKRFDEMMADGRLFTLGDAWPPKDRIDVA